MHLVLEGMPHIPCRACVKHGMHVPTLHIVLNIALIAL